MGERGRRGRERRRRSKKGEEGEGRVKVKRGGREERKNRKGDQEEWGEREYQFQFTSHRIWLDQSVLLGDFSKRCAIAHDY